jgi:hypothetical protein
MVESAFDYTLKYRGRPAMNLIIKLPILTCFALAYGFVALNLHDVFTNDTGTPTFFATVILLGREQPETGAFFIILLLLPTYFLMNTLAGELSTKKFHFVFFNVMVIVVNIILIIWFISSGGIPFAVSYSIIVLLAVRSIIRTKKILKKIHADESAERDTVDEDDE